MVGEGAGSRGITINDLKKRNGRVRGQGRIGIQLGGF